MKLEFTDEKFREYAIGNRVYRNTGDAIEVASSEAVDLLKAEGVANGVLQFVFKPAAEHPPVKAAVEQATPKEEKKAKEIK
jgi:hypothetical protein